MESSSSTRTTSVQKWQSNVRVLHDFPLQYHALVIANLSWKLISILYHGTPRWIAKLIRLILFVISLLPAFVVFACYYVITSDRIAVSYIQEIPKRTSRHYLDVYGSQKSQQQPKCEEGKAVVIFLTGGAWIIGYKMWGALLARALVPFGVLVIIPDYRNFPQTNIKGMIDDINAAIHWTFQNCHLYGGDPKRIVLVGQSAGAHIGSCVLLQKIQDAANSTSTNNRISRWSVGDLRGFIPVSGPYDLIKMRDILHQHGLDKGIVNAMFCNDLKRYSPTCLLLELDNNGEGIDISAEGTQRYRSSNDDTKSICSTTTTSIRTCNMFRSQFPPTCVIHGKTDRTVPYSISIDFFKALQRIQIQNTVSLKLYEGWGHTDPILEAPFAGDHTFHRDVFELVQLWTSNKAEKKSGDDSETFTVFDPSNPACKKICPSVLVNLGRFFNPF